MSSTVSVALQINHGVGLLLVLIGSVASLSFGINQIPTTQKSTAIMLRISTTYEADMKFIKEIVDNHEN